MKNSIEEEILRQISLINFDRSKPLLEQPSIEKSLMPSDRLGPQGQFQPLSYLKNKPAPLTADQIYKGLKYQIDSWGSDDEDIIYYVKSITSENYPKILRLVLTNENQASIMDWIMTDYDSVSERNAEEGEPELWSAGGLGATFGWWSNDKTVTTISKILSKFSYLNNGEGDYNITYNGEVDLSSDSLGGTASNEQLAAIAHIVLPIASVVATVFTGGIAGVLIGATLEIGDAAIYEFVDHDHYSAGLALLFAFAGPLDEVLGPLVNKFGKRILVKLMKKKALSESEQATLRYVTRNEKKLARLTTLGLARKLIKDYIKKSTDASKIVKFIFWLSKRGYLVANFTAKNGLLIGGTFVTWDKMAELMGLCNTVELEQLKQSDYKILQLIGTTGPYLQPYTKGCKTGKGDELLKKMDKTLLTINQRVLRTLEEGIQKNLSFSSKYSKYYLYEVELIQYLLNNLGFSYIIPDQKKVDKEVEKGVKWSKERCISQFMGSVDMYKMAQHPECNQYLNPNKKISKESEKLIKSKPLNDPNYKFEYGKNVGFNWGYYDKQTVDMVKEFQKKYGLSVDGVIGNQSLQKMLEIVKNLGDKKIPNYNNVKWSSKEIETLRNKAIEEIKKDMELNKTEIPPQEVGPTILEQKQQIINSLTNANESMEFTDDDLKAISLETKNE